MDGPPAGPARKILLILHPFVYDSPAFESSPTAAFSVCFRAPCIEHEKPFQTSVLFFARAWLRFWESVSTNSALEAFKCTCILG